MSVIGISIAGAICIFSIVCALGIAVSDPKIDVQKRLMGEFKSKDPVDDADEELSEVFTLPDNILRVFLMLVLLKVNPRAPGLRLARHRLMLLLIMVFSAFVGFWAVLFANPSLGLDGILLLSVLCLTVWAAMRVSASLWIGFYGKKRMDEIHHGLIDVLDLWVLCLGSGMSFQSSMVRVGQDEQLTSPALREELQLTMQEMLAGAPRDEALRHFVRRCGDSPDIRALVSQIIQAERMGSSLSNTLKVFSDTLRFKRRQDIQESIQKMPVKMAFPLIFFILPALFVIILGPAVIRMIEVFGSR